MNRDYRAPKVVSVFLATFDVKYGYKLVWAKSQTQIDLKGVEYKVLPSGIHELKEDLILFTHRDQQLYYGISKFRQINKHPESNDRANVKMFSLGCLCEPAETDWLPNTFTSNGYEYISYLDDFLLSYLQDGSLSDLENLDISTIPKSKFSNPINNLPEFFNKFGPLIFKIFKLGLLRKRIIIFNQNKTSNFLIETFNYLISILSVIPKELKVAFNHSENDYIQPLYNISLNDVDHLDFESFIATTNDDILMYQPVYDYAIVLNDGLKCPEILSFEDINNPKNYLKSTYNDYSKFKIIYQQLINNTELPHNKSMDNISINTSSSLLSNFKLFSSSNKINYEPNWWLSESTYPISWTQFIWSAFSWFASAGQYNNHLDQSQGQSSGAHLNIPNNLELVEIIGYFHKLTKKWIYLITEILSDTGDSHVELTYQDLIDLELDPYSKHDVDFITNFILLYWDVESVEISSGLNFFC